MCLCECVLRHKLSCCNVLSVWLLIKAEICGLVSLYLPPFPRYLFRFFLLLLSSLDHSLAFFLFLSRRFSAVCQFGSFNQQSTHICQSERSWDMPGVEQWREEEREGEGPEWKVLQHVHNSSNAFNGPSDIVSDSNGNWGNLSVKCQTTTRNLLRVASACCQRLCL